MDSFGFLNYYSMWTCTYGNTKRRGVVYVVSMMHSDEKFYKQISCVLLHHNEHVLITLDILLLNIELVIWYNFSIQIDNRGIKFYSQCVLWGRVKVNATHFLLSSLGHSLSLSYKRIRRKHFQLQTCLKYFFPWIKVTISTNLLRIQE